MTKKVKKQKNIKTSEKIFNTMSKYEKELAVTCRKLVELHKHNKLKDLFEFDNVDFELPSLDSMKNWTLEEEIKDIYNKKAIEVIEVTKVMLRCNAHMYLISKTPFEKRVKYLKDIEVWECDVIYKLLNIWLKDTNNHIPMDFVQGFPALCANLLNEQLLYDYNQEMKVLRDRLIKDYMASLESGLDRYFQLCPTATITRMRNFAKNCVNENINMALVFEAAENLLDLQHREGAEHIEEALCDMLLEYSQNVANQMTTDEMQVKEKSGSNFTHMSWKELEKFAKNADYKYIRSNGDHGIYKNFITKDTVVIPRGRSIGKGLQIQILKQIEEIN